MRYIPTDILQKIKEREQTLYNQADLKMEVNIARARTSVMDSTYWTVEKIREKAGLGDIAVASRRFNKHYGRPDRLYDIHVDNGIVKTTIREYPDYERQGWQPQFELGPGTNVAIAFDGAWAVYRKNWRFQTHETPWIFWVTNTGDLMAQLWDDTETLMVLATGVTNVTAMRGWNNHNVQGNDQGLIVGYVKGGRPYYRTLAFQLDGTKAWESEREITDFVGTSVNIGIFITNDYRIGILIEDNLGKIFWLITPRNWAGLALGVERVVVGSEAKVDFLPVVYRNTYEDEHINVSSTANIAYLFGATNNTLYAENIENIDGDWGWIIRLETVNPIEILTLSSILALDIEANTPIQISSIEALNNYEFLLHVSNMVESGINNVFGNISIKIEGALNGAGYVFDVFNYTFTPTNLVPVELPLPEVLEVWNE